MKDTQFSLCSFDDKAVLNRYKVKFKDGDTMVTTFESAYSEEEVKRKFPKAKEIKQIR